MKHSAQSPVEVPEKKYDVPHFSYLQLIITESLRYSPRLLNKLLLCSWAIYLMFLTLFLYKWEINKWSIQSFSATKSWPCWHNFLFEMYSNIMMSPSLSYLTRIILQIFMKWVPFLSQIQFYRCGNWNKETTTFSEIIMTETRHERRQPFSRIGMFLLLMLIFFNLIFNWGIIKTHNAHKMKFMDLGVQVHSFWQMCVFT